MNKKEIKKIKLYSCCICSNETLGTRDKQPIGSITKKLNNTDYYFCSKKCYDSYLNQVNQTKYLPWWERR